MPWFVSARAHAATVALADLDLAKVTVGWGVPGRNVSVGGQPLAIGGRKFANGLGVHASSLTTVQLDSKTTRFSALVGVDDEVLSNAAQTSLVEFLIVGDGKSLWRSGPMKAGDAPKPVSVALGGVRTLQLIVGTQGSDAYDHADWAQASLEYAGATPQLVAPPREEAVILTPRPKLTPRVNGARVFGARPNAPFLFKIAATGQKPLRYAAANLPPGLKLDPATGLITGRVAQPDTYRATITVANALGKVSRELRIEIGETINLTPPLGWNSWYRLSESVSQQSVLQTARAMVTSGLADHGWNYINIDDCWQGERTPPTRALQANAKFPAMKAMCDQIHALGLKAGIYSTPWMGSYAGFRGSSADNEDGSSSVELPLAERLQPGQVFGRSPNLFRLRRDHIGPYWFFDRDAHQWAQWGFDLVKVDWSPNDIATTERLARDLRASGRDIALSLSNSAPLDNAPQLSQEAQLWRTTGDIGDSWGSIAGIAEAQERWSRYTAPGHWNDPDMLQVGRIGNANAFNAAGRPTNLSPNEQYTQVSLWSLLSAPLLLSCDLEALDPFTLSLLTNDEVLEVNQDPLAAPALLARQGEARIWSKKLEDGGLAVGLFNFGEFEMDVTANFARLGLRGHQRARDLWRQQDVGAFTDTFTTKVPRHGVVLLKFTRVNPAK